MDNVKMLEAELAKMLKKFDIPDYRKTIKTIHNYRWLLENLGKRNSENVLYKRAIEILEILSRDKK